MDLEEIIYLIGQLLGFVAVALGILSYQMRSQKNLLLLQLITSGIFCLHYLMIGAVSGMALNVVGLLRNAVFFRRKLRGDTGKLAPIIFTLISAVIGIITWEAWFTVLYFAGMVIHSFCMAFSSSQNVRKSILVTSPLVIIYDAFERSYGGILYETVAIVSAMIGIIRHKNKRTE